MTLTSVERSGIADTSVTLDYEARLLRRRLLTLDDGRDVLVDLPATVSLDEGDLLAGDGLRVAVRAAPEPCHVVTGPELARYAWHVGNRHAPCEIEADALVIRADPVMADMLGRLGATLAETVRPFRPEGGAYGHGRTLGHSHGPAEGHSHNHGHDHGHSHNHGHTHP